MEIGGKVMMETKMWVTTELMWIERELKLVIIEHKIRTILRKATWWERLRHSISHPDQY